MASAPSASRRTRGIVLLACLACVCTRTDAASVHSHVHGQAHGRKLLFGPVQPPQYSGKCATVAGFPSDFMFPAFETLDECKRALAFFRGQGIDASEIASNGSDGGLVCFAFSSDNQQHARPQDFFSGSGFAIAGKDSQTTQQFADNMNKLMEIQDRMPKVE